MGNNIEVSIAHGLDVWNCFKYVPNFVKSVPNFVKDMPNFVKDVPNFVKDVPNFVKDVPRVPMSVLGWVTTSNSFSRVPKGIYKPWEWR